VAFCFSAAEAAVVTLGDGAVVDYQQNNVAAGAAGTFNGTIQQNGVTSDFSCAYDAVSGQVSGSAACGQLLSGLNLTDLERQFVAARVNVASALQARTNLQFLNDLVQRHVGADLTLSVRAAGVGADASTAFGSPSFQSFGFGGGSFLDDDRLGFEKSGHNYIATVGLDHAEDNTLIGGYIGYVNTNIDLKSLSGDYDSDGWVAGLYVTQVLSQRFSVTASGAYGDSTVDLRRTFTGTAVTASYGHKEWSGAVTANMLLVATDAFALSGLGGIMYGGWKDNGYTDSRGITFNSADGDNTYAKVGGVVSFLPASAVRPYGFATYNRLLSDPNYNGRNALNVGGGLAIGAGRFTGAAEVSTLLLQQGQSATSIGLHLRLAI
jgi:hypothetical protein